MTVNPRFPIYEGEWGDSGCILRGCLQNFSLLCEMFLMKHWWKALKKSKLVLLLYPLLIRVTSCAQSSALKIVKQGAYIHICGKFCLYCVFLLVPWAHDTLPARLFSPVPEAHLKKSFILLLLPSSHLLFPPPLPPHLVLGLSTLARVLLASISLDGKSQKGQ